MTLDNSLSTRIVKIRRSNLVQYFQCPYCTKHIGGHGKRVPKTVGKYRVKAINSFFIFTCLRCGKEFKVEFIPKLYLWSKMSRKQREEFKSYNYKGGKKTNDKNI